MAFQLLNAFRYVLFTFKKTNTEKFGHGHLWKELTQPDRFPTKEKYIAYLPESCALAICYHDNTSKFLKILRLMGESHPELFKPSQIASDSPKQTDSMKKKTGKRNQNKSYG